MFMCIIIKMWCDICGVQTLWRYTLRGTNLGAAIAGSASGVVGWIKVKFWWQALWYVKSLYKEHGATKLISYDTYLLLRLYIIDFFKKTHFLFQRNKIYYKALTLSVVLTSVVKIIVWHRPFSFSILFIFANFTVKFDNH